MNRTGHAPGQLDGTECCCGGERVLRNPVRVRMNTARELNPGPGSDGFVRNLSLIRAACICDVRGAPVCALVSACVQTARPNLQLAEIVPMMRLRGLVELPDVELQLAGKIAKAMEVL